MTTLYMLTSQSKVQMMSFIIISNDHLIVIDGGNTCDAEYLCTYIKKLGGKVDAWFLTHPHSDHIGALRSTLERFYDDIKIEGIYANFPPLDFINSSGDPDTKSDSVEKLYAMLYERGRSITTVHTGDTFEFGPDMKLTVLREPDLSLTENRINNASVVYRLDACPQNKGGRSVIFLGDLGKEGGEHLLNGTPKELLKADYVQTAHHGQQGVGKEVYDAIDPDYCLWCTPDWLWDNNAGRGYDTGPWKTIVTRGWLSDLGIRWHYVSKDGTHEVPLDFDDH